MAARRFDANTGPVNARSSLRFGPWVSGSLALCAMLQGCARAAPASSPEAHPTVARPSHPLVFGIFAREGAARVEEASFFEKLVQRPFVLVGEKHDNVEHHAFEARVVAAVGRVSPRAVAMEHFRAKDQPKLDAFFANASSRAADLPREVGWEEGWGPFGPFERIFANALAQRMPLVAANFDRLDVRALREHPEAAFSADVRAELARVTFADTDEKSLAEELHTSHCGHLPGDFLAPMVLAQHARDAQFALAMRGSGRTSAVLLAGKGHTRGDRGVPRFLPLGSFVSVAMVEVEDGKVEPRAYEELGTHDYVYFTPRAPADEDPCAAFRHPSTKISPGPVKGPS